MRVIKKIPIYLIFGFIILPVFMVLWISFFSTELITFPPKGYSLKWYQSLPEQLDFLKSFYLSLKVSFLAMIISLILGLAASIVLIRYDFKGKKIFELLFISPLIVPTIISGIAIYMFLFRVQSMFEVGLVPSFWSLVLAHVIIGLPWSVRIISAGLLNINPSLEEASINLGSTRFGAFMNVVLPNLKPSIIAAAVLSFIYSFNNLEISLMLVMPGETTLPIEILNYVFWQVDPLIATVSTVQILIIGILMWIVSKIVNISKVM